MRLRRTRKPLRRDAHPEYPVRTTATGGLQNAADRRSRGLVRRRGDGRCTTLRTGAGLGAREGRAGAAL